MTSTGPDAEIGLADTSMFITVEQNRPMSDVQPSRIAVSTVTVGELALGVLCAADAGTRAQRLDTLRQAESLEPLSIDADVASRWAALRVALRDAGRRMPVNDSWIAATALAHGMPVVTQDDDYDDVPGLSVVRV